MSEVTQEEVNRTFNMIKEEWDSMVKASGKTEKMFVAIGDGAPSFLYQHQQLKEQVEGLGLIMPVLVEGLTITEHE